MKKKKKEDRRSRKNRIAHVKEGWVLHTRLDLLFFFSLSLRFKGA